jgi:hypothetical protein
MTSTLLSKLGNWLEKNFPWCLVGGVAVGIALGQFVIWWYGSKQ